MRKILLASVAFILLATLIFSFKKPNHKTGTQRADCSPYVTVHASGSGILLTLVVINGHIYPVSLSNGQSQDFTDPSWTQGSTITVSVSCAGGGSHTRMRSIEISNPFQCVTYPNYVTTASITGTKQCAAMQVEASTAPICP